MDPATIESTLKTPTTIFSNPEQLLPMSQTEISKLKPLKMEMKLKLLLG